MRSRISFVFILSALWLFACDFPGILGGDDSSDINPNPDAASDTLLYVQITGGIAGVNQNLVVRESGLTLFSDSFHGGAEWRVKLSPTEISALKRLMLTNGFLLLQDDQYIDSQVADAFFYDIRFFADESPHRVITDRFGAPNNLRNIVDGVRDLIESITQNGLILELTLSSEEIEQGDTVNMSLKVTNQSPDVITLKFNSGQIFDFHAIRYSLGVTDSLVWNWAHDQFFTQELRQIELGVGESRSYMVEWDGRDNNDDLLSGDFAVAGKLVSIPGGTTPRKLLRIIQ